MMGLTTPPDYGTYRWECWHSIGHRILARGVFADTKWMPGRPSTYSRLPRVRQASITTGRGISWIERLVSDFTRIESPGEDLTFALIAPRDLLPNILEGASRTP